MDVIRSGQNADEFYFFRHRRVDGAAIKAVHASTTCLCDDDGD